MEAETDEADEVNKEGWTWTCGRVDSLVVRRCLSDSVSISTCKLRRCEEMRKWGSEGVI